MTFSQSGVTSSCHAFRGEVLSQAGMSLIGNSHHPEKAELNVLLYQ